MANVLVVDDSAFARNSLRRVLEGAGHAVTQADSGEAAIRLAPGADPDVVTLDLLMPGLSGQETLVELKKICPRARYIIVTADIQEVTKQELLDMGASGFLNKPVQADVLLANVARLAVKG